MTKRSKKGFTIAELVIVIAVIAILAAVLIPTFTGVISSANKSASLQTCKNGLTNYQGQVADDEQALNAMDGMVFVSKDYAYVYLNGQLVYLGQLKDLLKMNQKGDFANLTADNQAIVAITGPQAPEKLKTINGGSVELRNEEVAYFYTVNSNGKSYYGFFTYFTGTVSDDYECQSEGAIYSRVHSPALTAAVEVVYETVSGS